MQTLALLKTELFAVKKIQSIILFLKYTIISCLLKGVDSNKLDISLY